MSYIDEYVIMFRWATYLQQEFDNTDCMDYPHRRYFMGIQYTSGHPQKDRKVSSRMLVR
jgi:hypothetical protein